MQTYRLGFLRRKGRFVNRFLRVMKGCFLDFGDLCCNFVGAFEMLSIAKDTRVNSQKVQTNTKTKKTMSIYYKLYQNKRKGSTTKDKWYARSAVMGKTVSLEDLAEHMAQHNTPYSEGVIKGVLTDMITCIRELVLEGKAVKIPNLCIFSAGISTAPADSAKDFTVAANVKSVYLRSRTTGKFTRDEITRLANLRELTNYSVNKEDETQP